MGLPWQQHLHHLAIAVILLLEVMGAATAAPASEEAIEHYAAAARHAEQGALTAAVIELKNALQQDPDYGEARLLLGELYLRLGDGETAEKELRRARDLGEDRARVAVPLITALLLQGRFDQVLSELDLQQFTGQAAIDALLLRADAKAGLGKTEEARAHYDEVIAKQPADPRAYLGRSRLALTTGDLALAEAEAGEALARAPQNAEALLVEAEARRRGGRPDEAARSFRAALDSPALSLATMVRARLGLATTLLMLGRDADAGAELAALEAAAPGLPLAAYLDAMVQLRQNDIEGARRRLDPAAPALENFAPAQFLFAIVAYGSGQMETALNHLRRHLAAMPGNLPARKLMAATLLRLGSLEEAEKELESARAQAPDDPQVLMMLGNAQLRAGKTSEAMTLLGRAAELAPQDPRVLGQLAVGHLASGENTAALAALGATLDLNEEASALGYAMAFVHLRAGAFDDALRVAQDLRRRFPQSALAANLEGGARAGLGQKEEALQAFEAAIARDPALHEARANLAALKAQAGDLAGAEAAYRKILAADATQLRGLLGMAAVAERRGDHQAMGEWLERAVIAEPGDVRTSLALAQYLAAAGDATAAVTVLTGLAARQPGQPQVLMALGRYQQQSGDAVAAAATYMKLVAATGGSAAAHLLLAEAQLRASDFEAARRSYEELAKLAPDDPVVWNNLAWLYHQAGDERATAHAERALELAPDRPAVLDTVGWILLEKGAEIERGAAMLEQAHKAVPGSGDIAYRYAVALHRLGKNADALTLLQAILQEGRPFSQRTEAEALMQSLTR